MLSVHAKVDSLGMLNILAISDLNDGFVRVFTDLYEEITGLNLSKVAFHSTPRTLVKLSVISRAD